MTAIEVIRSADAPADLLLASHQLVLAAFTDGFAPEDWHHALGGFHVVATEASAVVAHAAVVPRSLVVGGRAMSAGYVEAVATDPARRRCGLGSSVMTAVADVVRREFEIGALSTGLHHFYERLGWQRWRGPTFVRRGDQLVRTPDEDDGLMVLVGDIDVDLTAPIACEQRAGDDW